VSSAVQKIPHFFCNTGQNFRKEWVKARNEFKRCRLLPRVREPTAREGRIQAQNQKVKIKFMKNRTITFTAILFALGFPALAPSAHALNPPPDGGYGGANTAAGTGALYNLVIPFRNQEGGDRNTALGFETLFSLTTGDDNTATGYQALFANTGGGNTATGVQALFHNTADRNTAHGYQALFSNEIGFENTALGFQALYSHQTGIANTAVGYQALFHADGFPLGNTNTAVGYQALFHNTFGHSNTAVGSEALENNTGGLNNIAVGRLAGFSVTTASNVICIGDGGADVSDSCYIGNIFGQASGDGVPVFVNSNNKLGTSTSSKRFKEKIEPMGKRSEELFSLRPVAFRYKHEIDPTGRSQFGLVAEDVEKVNPDLVVRDKEGKPYTVRYDQVNTMLLNEFLKEHRRNEEQQATIAELKSTVAQQQRAFQSKLAEQEKQIEAVAAGLQKVSMQLELEKRLGQAVAEN
jgi:hypothetical protein